MLAGAIDIRKRADRLVQHQRHRRDAATAALASQSSESQGCSNSSICAGSSAEAKRIPCSRLKARLASSRSVARVPDRLLDHLDAREIGVDVLADLHLEGAEALREPRLDFLLDAGIGPWH